MRYYTHIIGSLIFASFFAIIFDVPINSLYIFVAVIVAPLPDLIEYMFELDDHKVYQKRSPRTKKTRWSRLCNSVRDTLHLPNVKLVSGTSHNRCTHNLLVLFISLSLLYFSIPVGLAAFSALFSHIFLDIFTMQGCPLLYPFREVKFVALKPRNRIRTGSRREKALFIFLTLVVFSGLFCYFNLFTLVDGHLYSSDDTVTVTATTTDNTTNTTNTTYYNRDKSNINLNVYPDKKGEKNITIKYQDQETNILIKDLDDEK